MALVVGLGNPGARYRRTRHNAGRRVLERLVERWNARLGDTTSEYRWWETEVKGHPVQLLLPETFMNRSGDALREWSLRHRFALDELLAVADDVYLPIGYVRLRRGGSSGGHRGLESIEAALGTRDYARLRIGVGEAPSEELKQHVLEEPPALLGRALDEVVGIGADAVECWIGEGMLAAMNRFNRRVRKEVSEP